MTRRTALLGASGGVAAASAGWLALADDAPRIKLRLLETSDLHMFVYAYDYFHTRADPTVGLARVASLIRHARAEAANTLLFDNGDIIQGSPLGDYEARPGILADGQVHPMFRAMNLLGYDAATLGNHEFNYGLEFLDRALAGAAFPFVCANLDHADGRSYLPRTMVLERTLHAEGGGAHTLRIGVIGFVPPQIMVWDRAKLEGRVATADIVEAAEREIPGLRTRCDVLIALCHSGISTAPRHGGDENAAYHLAQVGGIDAIFTGHSHRVFPGPDYAGRSGVDAERGTLAGVPATMPGFWGSHLGVIDLNLVRDGERWRVEGFAVEARPIFRRASRPAAQVEDDPAILKAAAPEHAATIAWVGQPAGHLARPISSFFALAGDDTVVALVNEAQLWYARPLLADTAFATLPLLSAAAPFKAGGFSPQNYVDLAAGPIAMKDVADLYGYPNTLCAVRVTGAGLREWLERAADVFLRVDPARDGPHDLVNTRVPAYVFDVIAGVTYRIDLSHPSRYGANGEVAHPTAHRIVDLRYAGAPIDPAQEFVVVTNNYRADGGGKFPGLVGGDGVVLRAPDSNRDVVQHYIQSRPAVDPARSGTWSFAPLRRPVTLVFDSAPEAADALDARLSVRAFGPGQGGFARYALDLA